jgi:cytochrome c-type biogenesis protein CcmF
MASFGGLVLMFALLVTAYGGAAAVVGARRGSRRLVDSAIAAVHTVTGLMALGSATIIYAFVSHDYSIKYVQHYSDASMPLFYKITAYWGGLDGSLMFWVLLLTAMSSVAVALNKERHREMIPYVVATLMSITGFFLVLLVFAKNPFDTYIAEAAPIDGKGLNPLLQNFYMIFHPPSLYTGFVSASIPFAFGMGALLSGHLDDQWLHSVRRWVIFCWFFLSLGLILGSLWAYEELGWGGYWAWDPVENAGFLPWLTATAFLHSAMVQERRGMLKIWNVSLVCLTFLLTIFGTFMTRSGVVQSVHAFGEDKKLAWTFTGFMVLIIAVSVGMILKRLPLLRTPAHVEKPHWLSREFAFVVNNWALLVACLFVAGATMWPTLSEALFRSRQTVGPPFFNQWMAPIGLILLGLTGVGPLIAWRKATLANLQQQFLWPLVWGGATVAVCLIVFPFTAEYVPVFRRDLKAPLPLVCFGLCGFVMAALAQELIRGTLVRKRQTGLDVVTAFIGLVVRGRRRYGGYFIHLAIVLMFFGWAGDAFQREAEVTLSPGQHLDLAPYRIVFKALQFSESAEKEEVTAQVDVLRLANGTKGGAGELLESMAPARWFYHKHVEDPTTEVAIRRSPAHDLYLILGGYDVNTKVANLKVVINPLVDWIWFGFAWLAFGTALCIAPERLVGLMAAGGPAPSSGASPNGAAGGASAGGLSSVNAPQGTQGVDLSSVPVTEPRPLGGRAGRMVTVLLTLATVGLAVLGGVGIAKADSTHQSTTVGAVEPAWTPRERDLFESMACLCGTCPRHPLSVCKCDNAARERERIKGMLAEGKTKKQVIDWYVTQYRVPGSNELAGQSVLTAPLNVGWNKILYNMPYAALLGGMGLLWVLARRWRRRAAEPLGSTEPFVANEKLESQLDDELSSLE